MSKLFNPKNKIRTEFPEFNKRLLSGARSRANYQRTTSPLRPISRTIKYVETLNDGNFFDYEKQKFMTTRKERYRRMSCS